jgi:NAD(P)-dependent dehydrogenase (short-subunit alcohol dehydrogenase family)
MFNQGGCDMNRVQGKRAIITGASRGLGRQLAIDFAREGAASLVLVSRDKQSLKETQKLVEQVNPDTKALIILADLSRADEIERVVAQTLREFQGKLNILVNNASILGPTPMPYLLDYPLEDFRQVINTNLIAPYLLIQKLVAAMMENGGSIINVTSDAGINGYPGWGAYGISKFGLEGLSQTWAAELEGSGVRINWVDPGNMNTLMHRLAEPEEDPSQWAHPAEVTEVFLYLASDESKDINGKRFQAQEGWSELLQNAG